MSKEKLIEEMEGTGFIKTNNYKVIDVIENKSATLKAIISDSSMNPYKIVHGGFIFGLGDTAMGVAAASTGRGAVTISANINYLKKATGKFLIANAEILKSGKTTCYLETKIFNDKNELVATMNSTYFYV